MNARILFVLALFALMFGCIEMKVDQVLNNDGSSVYTYTTDYSGLMALAGDSQYASMTESFGKIGDITTAIAKNAIRERTKCDFKDNVMTCQRTATGSEGFYTYTTRMDLGSLKNVHTLTLTKLPSYYFFIDKAKEAEIQKQYSDETSSSMSSQTDALKGEYIELKSTDTTVSSMKMVGGASGMTFTYGLTTPWTIKSATTDGNPIGKVEGRTFNLDVAMVSGPIVVMGEEDAIPGGWITVILVLAIIVGAYYFLVMKPKTEAK